MTPNIKGPKLTSNIDVDEEKTCNRRPFMLLDGSISTTNVRLGNFTVKKSFDEKTDFLTKTNRSFSTKKEDTKDYSKERNSRYRGVPFRFPKEPTQIEPFNLSQSNLGSIVKRNRNEKSSPPHFQTKVDSLIKTQNWPGPLKEERHKRRSVSQEFKRDSKLSNEGYRVTFTNKPGENFILPLRTDVRAQSR